MDYLFGSTYNSLTQHITVLQAEGYDDTGLLRDAEVVDLEELGIHKVHATEIIDRVKAAVEGSDPNLPLRTSLKVLLKCEGSEGNGDYGSDSDSDDDQTESTGTQSTGTQSTGTTQEQSLVSSDEERSEESSDRKCTSNPSPQPDS